MTIHHAQTTAATAVSSDVVLEVPSEDQDAYTRHSYHDLMHAWNALVDELTEARRSGATTTVARITEELRQFWPRPNSVAGVAWVTDDDRESALLPEQNY